VSEHANELQQRFADAALELWMEEYAQAEGYRLLEAYRQESSDTARSEALDAHCQKTIRKANQRMLIGSTLKRAARTAACLLIMLMLAFPMAMSVEAFRIPVMNFILKEGKGFTAVSFTQNTSSFSALDYLREVIWEAVPDGYQLSAENVHTDKYMGNETVTSLFVRFQNEKEHFFVISVTKAKGTISIDTDDADITTMELSGQQAVIVAKEDEIRAMWINEDQGQVYDVVGYGTGPDAFWECVHKLSKSTYNPQNNISF